MVQFREWTSGCYGFKYPATVAAVDAVVYRTDEVGTVLILVGTRGEGRWGAGLPMLGIGGFIDPTDASALETVRRELNEEVPGIDFDLEEVPFCLAGPGRYNHTWDSKTRTAIKKDELAQDVPIQNMTFLARWTGGEPQPTKEVTVTRWISLRELARIEQEFFTDQALILEALVKKFQGLI